MDVTIGVLSLIIRFFS